MAIQTSADNQVTVLSASWNNAAAAYTAFKLDVNNILTPPSSVLFDVGTNTGTYTSRFIIDVSGSVGIGTTITNGNRVAISGGNLSVSGSVLPFPDNSVDLGSTTYRWRTLFATNISGSLTPTGATAGSVFFAGSSGQIEQDNSNFFWDDTNNRLGIGTANPSQRLDIASGTMRGLYYASTYDGELLAGADAGGYYYGTGFGKYTAIPMFIGSNATNIIFGAGNAERMRIIGSSGNVAIGATPATLLSRLYISGSSTSSTSVLMLRAGVASPSARVFDIYDVLNNSVASIDHLGNIYARTGSYSGDVSIAGNLTVLGVQTYVSSTVVDIGDNIITLNSTANPQRYGGLYVNDTTANTTGSLLWDSDNNYWVAGLKGSEAIVPTGTGTNNLVARWTSASTLSTGILYDTTARVGINSSTPNYELDIVVNTNGFDGVNLYGAQGGASEFVGYRAVNPNNVGLVAGVAGAFASSAIAGANIPAVYSVGSIPLVFGTNSIERVRITSAGDVGIGTTSYTARLFVSGSSTGTTPTLLVQHGVANGSNLPVVDVKNSAGTSLLFVSGSGRTGVGTNNPQKTLHVIGDAGVSGVTSTGSRRLSLGILDINSSVTPTQIRINTTIPLAAGSADFTVNIKGFRYGGPQMVSLSIGWHYYLSSFYNANAISNGGWQPTIQLAADGNGNVVIHLSDPGYWPKLYVESVYSSAYNDSYSTGWTWTDADLTGMTNVTSVTYKPLATSVSGSITVAGLTQGSVLFGGSGGTIAQDNANFFWDDANNRLGIGTATPYASLNTYSAASGVRIDMTGVDDNEMLTLNQTNGYNAGKGSWVAFRQAAGASPNLNMRFGYISGASADGFHLQRVAGTDLFSILNSGFVGIGISIPTSLLHIVTSGTGNSTLLHVQSANGFAAGGATMARFGNTGSDSVKFGFDFDSTSFQVRNGNTDVALMSVRNAGAVGIGITNPSTYKLDVQPTTATARLGNAIVGAWPASTDYALFGHNSISHASTGNYALLQSNDGTTFVNAAATKRLYFRIDNTDSALIDYNRNMIVGSKSSQLAAARLEVTGSATASTPTMLVREGVVSPTGGALAFEVEKSSGATLFAVSGSGNVGIGTSIPNATFEVVGVSGSLFSVTDSLSGSLFSVNTISGLPILEVFSDNTLIAGAYNSNALVVTGSNVGVGVRAPSVRFQVSGSSISAVPTSLFKAGVGSPTGAILDVQQSDGTSLLYVSGSSSTNYVTAYGVSQTSPSNTAGIFRVLSSATNALIMGALTNSPFATYIQSGGGNQYPLSLNPLGGNVGVGITNPSAKLHVYGGSLLIDNGTNNQLSALGDGNIELSRSGGNAYIDLKATTATDYDTRIQSVGSGATADLSITTSGYGEVGRFTYTGRVGIGTASVDEKLHVAGNYIKLKNYSDADAGLVLDSGSSTTYTTQIILRDRGADKFYIRKNSSNNFDIYNSAASSVSLTIDSAGNFGVGLVPTASTTSKIQTNADISVIYSGAQTLHLNGYYSTADNNWKYGTTGQFSGAVRFDASKGDLQFWNSSASGTAGSTSNIGLRMYITGSGGHTLPGADNTYDLGTTAVRWRNLYLSNTLSAPSLAATGLTLGSVVFAGSGGILSQNNANFFWDNTNARLGIGTNVTTSTAHKVTVVGTDILVNSVTVGRGGTGAGASTSNTNAAVGVNALSSIDSTALYNSALGTEAASTGTKSYYNTAVGFQALLKNNVSTDGKNTAVGAIAMYNDSSGVGNTAVGYASLYNNSSTTGHVAVGFETLYEVANGSNNTAVGYQALKSTFGNTVANSVAVGYRALTAATVPGNVAVGMNAMLSTTNTSGSVAVGFNALADFNGGDNTTVGWAAGRGLKGVRNTAVGTHAMPNSSTSYDDATSVGAFAGFQSRGSGNTFLGSNAGYLTTTSSEVTALGLKAAENATASKIVAAGAYALRSANSTGNVGIGYSSLATISSNSGSTAVGYLSLTLATGADNTGLGWQAGDSISTGAGNVAVGSDSLVSNTTATGNTAVGTRSLYSITTVSGSTAVGYEALFSTTGADNTALGWRAGRGLTTAANSVAIGSMALSSGTGGFANTATGTTAVGAFALQTGNASSGTTAVGWAAGSVGNMTGWYNTLVGGAAGAFTAAGAGNNAFGYAALYLNTTGSDNVAIGNAALYNNTSAFYNVGVGNFSLNSNQSSRGNIAIGHRSLYTQTGGVSFNFANFGTSTWGLNVAVGMESLVSSSTGAYNTSIGNASGYKVTTGIANTFVGYGAGQNVTIGGSNVFIGADAGRDITTGNNNVVIGGHYASSPFSTQSGNIFIADGSGTLRMTITGSTGNVGIGRTNPGSAFKLDVSGSINAFNINKTYSLPDVGGSASWIKLGTFTASQGGRHLYIKVVTSNGYNANPAQQSEVHIHFKTSNGSSVDSNGFAGEATFYITNGSTAPGHNVKVKGNAAGTSATSYDVWFYQGGAYNGTSFYTVETPSDYTGISWDHAGTTGSDPGAASNTVCVGSQRFVVQSDVGIGVTTPGTKFHVDGTIRNTNMPAGILNYYIGVDGNWNIFPVVSSAKYKENITPYVTGLSKVLSLMPVTYNYKIDNSREFAGLLAEDLHNLGLKEFVLYKNDIPESIDYPNMVTLTINAIKELKSENDSLKSEIQSLKDQISSILEMLSNK